MTRLLFSVRITEKYFSPSEIESLEQELESFNSKSGFMRKIIKFYLKNNKVDLNSEQAKDTTEELKELLEENNSLLQQLVTDQPQTSQSHEQVTAAYEGEKQANKTNQALSLLEQF